MRQTDAEGRQTGGREGGRQQTMRAVRCQQSKRRQGFRRRSGSGDCRWGSGGWWPETEDTELPLHQGPTAHRTTCGTEPEAGGVAQSGRQGQPGPSREGHDGPERRGTRDGPERQRSLGRDCSGSRAGRTDRGSERQWPEEAKRRAKGTPHQRTKKCSQRRPSKETPEARSAWGGHGLVAPGDHPQRTPEEGQQEHPEEECGPSRQT